MGVLDHLVDALTDDPEVTDLRVGAFFTAVVSRGVGLASTLRRVPHARGRHPALGAWWAQPSPTTGDMLGRSEACPHERGR